jgi:hypothetical protein
MLAPYTDTIWIYGLSIEKQSDRGWQNVQGILNRHYPSLKEKIKTVIFSNDHSYWTQLKQDLLVRQKDTSLSLSINL